VQSYLQWWLAHGNTASGKRLRPSKASTIATRRREIEAFARKAVQIGIEAHQLSSLAALFDPDVVVGSLMRTGSRMGRAHDLHDRSRLEAGVDRTPDPVLG
jgi:hypothetical protein